MVVPQRRALRGSSLGEVVAETLGARGVPQLAQRLRLDLTNALAGDAELAPHLFQRAAAVVLQTEAKLEYLPFSRRQ